MADRTTLEFTTILGINVDIYNDYIPIINVAGATLTDKNRKITPAEFLRLAMSISGMVSLMDAVTLPTTSGSAAFPATGGTGTSGAILKGNAFPVDSPGGYIPGSDEPQFCPEGTLLIALEDNPGTDVTKWRQL